MGFLGQALRAITRLVDADDWITSRNAANGYAGLDETGKLPPASMPTDWQIQHRRGTEAELAAYGLLAQGEWFYATDSKNLYFGTGAVNELVQSADVATQTVIATNFTVTHNQRRYLLLTATTTNVNATFACLNTVNGFQAGIRIGQELNILVNLQATSSNEAVVTMNFELRGTANPAAALNVLGNRFKKIVSAQGDAETPVTTSKYFYVSYVWDGTNWIRRDAWSQEGCQDTGELAQSFGANNQATGKYSFAAGEQNIVSGFKGCAFGYNQTVTGEEAVAFGSQGSAAGVGSFKQGYLTRTVGDYSMAMGMRSKSRWFASLALGSSNLDTAYEGNHQVVIATASRLTVDAVPIAMGAGFTQASILDVQPTRVMTFIIQVAGYNESDNQGVAYIFRGAIRRNAAGGTAILGAVSKEAFEDAGSAACDCNVTANDANDSIAITVQGIAGKTIWWSASVLVMEAGVGDY